MNLYVLLANQPTARFDSLGDAPQYVYDGVSLTYESGVMRIWTSPDWDSGDFDYYYGIDRTKDELIEDMEIIYEKYGKTPPKHF